jgi:tryptophan synthase alpha chain
VLEKARSEKRTALIAYVCAGDPSLEATRRLVPQLAEAGADIIEIGIPFSDPLADGPVIQAASQRALDAGVSPKSVLEVVRQIRQDGCQVPLVLMGYMNPMVVHGLERFCQDAAQAGADGLIVPDLSLDEAPEMQKPAAAAGLDVILLAAPTTLEARLKKIGQATRGFLYFVSITGVTGGRVELPPELPAQLKLARSVSPVPVAVGFGVSTAGQARRLAAHADAVIVGSALVQLIHDTPNDFAPVLARVRELSKALQSVTSL